MNKIRVRFPPSPTGIPHIGNTRTALFNFLFARHHKGVFILRIEDTDRARLVEGAEKAIKEILNWLGLIWDEFYKQSERIEIYQKAAEELMQKGLAKKDEGAIRFIVSKSLPAGRRGETISWVDAIGSKNISFRSDDIEDFIILKSDGFPTYHLANVVDDHEMEISHVIRGDEWISSVPKHILLYRAFGWEHPIFAHLPVIVGADKTKLSKRHGADSVLDYRAKGFLKEALLNYMAFLGWNSGEDREIMDMDTMIKLFDLADVNTASPMFDSKKLEWMNGLYIRQLSVDELISNIKLFAKANFASKNQISNFKVDDRSLQKIIPLAQSRMKTLNDFDELVAPWFNPPRVAASDKKLLGQLVGQLGQIKKWDKNSIFDVIKKFCDDNNVNLKVVYRLLTGKVQGLPIADMLVILGKEKLSKWQ